MFRNLILLLVTYPLLMPSGMCFCGAVRGRGDSSRIVECRDARASLDPCCEGTKVNCRSTDEQCPPSCPANKKADHSKLADKSQELAAAWAAASTSLSFCVDISSTGQRIPTATPLSQPSTQPIYIRLCSLVI